MTKTILSLTGTRSDYGLMRPVFSAIKSSPTLKLDLLVTGLHYLPEFSNSLAQVKLDQFGSLFEFPVGTTRQELNDMNLVFTETCQAINRYLKTNKPDLVLLQGDRGEMLALAICAGFKNLPIIHMSGGDQTGSIDNSIRDAITSFAHLHLTTNALSTKRLIQMGESKARIYEVGEPALDVINSIKYQTRDAVAKTYGFDSLQPIVVFLQHPVTTEANQAGWQMEQSLGALSEAELQTIVLYPNADTGAVQSIEIIKKYQSQPLFFHIPNVSHEAFLNLLHSADLLVGNSSAGILEAPSFKLPVVNIGTRQNLRLQANNVINCFYQKEAISQAISKALSDDKFQSQLVNCQNPYGDGHTAEKTVEILENLKLDDKLISKWL